MPGVHGVLDLDGMPRGGGEDCVSVELLGELRVRVGGRPVDVVAGKQRLLLVALCVSGERPVRAEELVDRLWGDEPPASARTTLRGYVRRLRGTLGASARECVTGGRGGYRVGDGVTTDLARFRVAWAAARRCGEPAARLALFEEALSHWRGRPLSGVEPVGWVREVVTGVEEELLQAVEEWCDLHLDSGDAGRALVRLTGLVADHPLRETLWFRLIRGLHGCGRTAEALERYEHVRGRLGEDLGVSPSALLRELHRALLLDDRRRPSAPPSLSMASR
ncbi:BTAD domain-containing putative transcriptional regulator [Saccharothrix longispora]|uniref:AfsR/SARP family transcriptional regulator n=1 Tax=Saccharothrix longispora TaxID=33920 RepID=UPI0028FD3018|nr:BTAD domain-containing putative transcriptional regulator [Saccharothrix longispora]MDU0289720.1 BTAD domain-containing putative transcriptional regulator [Saccharothrix longispora]